VRYRVVYDVLDDGALPGIQSVLVMLGAALLFMLGVLLTYRLKRQMPPAKRRRILFGLIPCVLLVPIGAWGVASRTCPALLDQRQCKAWARAGDYQTVEGSITHRGGSKSSMYFQVAGVDFTCTWDNPRTGGFCGDFTAPGEKALLLLNGLPVRVAHWDGRILRLEVAD
jgi:hypothetical protein